MSELLRSISAQKDLPEPGSMQIIVIDNDRDGSARQIVASFAIRSMFRVVYDVEPVQNIALTRNRALAHVKGDYVIFVDDDEVVSAYWMKHLVHCAETYDADVVFGPVVPVLPETAAPWIRKGGFYYRRRYDTGTSRDRGGTGNALVKAEIFRRMKTSFDPTFGRTGGSDTKLFYSLHRKGFRLVWCNEAEVYERVPHDRMTVKWLSLRAFRGGQVFIRVFFRDMPLFNKMTWCFLRTALLLSAAACIPLCFILGRHLGVKALQQASAYLGQLTAVAGLRQYEEYRHVS